MKNDKFVKLKLNPPLWIEDWGGDDATFEYKKETKDMAKDAYCVSEVQVSLSEIMRKIGVFKKNKQGVTDFLFIDETGISLDSNQSYFGVGGLRIKDATNINRQLHNIFTGALSFLNQKEERFEFKFSYVTHRSFRFYKEIISLLRQSSDWDFQYILEKKEASWQKETFWGRYLEYVNLLVNKWQGRDLILLSDYLSKPKEQEKDLFNVMNENKHILNFLQLESQGSLLLQAADILLGGVAYQKRIESNIKTDELKFELSNLIVDILSNKKEQL